MAPVKSSSFDDLPDAPENFTLIETIGEGVFGCVSLAEDNGRKVAVKIYKAAQEAEGYAQQEYKILKSLSDHPNLAEFYGVYKKKDEDKIWFVLEYCELGPVTDLVNGLLMKNRRMAEEHIAFVLNETVKALVYLHENLVLHRNLKASNVLLTRDGEIKVVDFSLSGDLKNVLSKRNTCIGSPCWMAPEIISGEGYGCRADVWSLGVVAIELGDGVPPYNSMHPSRAMFQIVRNPPPTLYRPSNWSEIYNDFIDECLVKNEEYRPFMAELQEHPFLMDLPENCYHMTQELKALSQEYSSLGKSKRLEEVIIKSKLVKRQNQPDQKILLEDLAAQEEPTLTKITTELIQRFNSKTFHTYIGDILLIINPNTPVTYDHSTYKFKSISENPPNIFGVADSAYQKALHHKTSQQILLTGETASGKTTNFNHLVDHLLFLGENPNINTARIKGCVELLQAFVHASTKCSGNSTRCLFRCELTFGRSGRVSGAVFRVRHLEKWRMSSVDMDDANFHFLYYFYDAQAAKNNLNKYKLNENRENHRYLRINNESTGKEPRNSIETNPVTFENLESVFTSLDFTSEEMDTIYKILAAILALGDLRFASEDEAVIENEDCAEKVANLLGLDVKKLCWALTNYCLISKGTAVKKKHSSDKARRARDVLANNLYSRLIDFVVNAINSKLAVGRKIFGDTYSIKLTDLYGFESFKSNHLPQLYVNCMNEQLQYFYNQTVFAWETLELNEEGIDFNPIQFYDNKLVLDQIFRRPEGLLSLIDDASKKGNDGTYITENLERLNYTFVRGVNPKEFSIAHFTGTVVYEVKEMPDKNKDFLPPEVIEVLRLSEIPLVKSLFTNKLDKFGNLLPNTSDDTSEKLQKFSTTEEDFYKPGNHFSQIRGMRTTSSTFRALSLSLLKELSASAQAGSLHFVRCVRANLEDKPFTINTEILRQQLKALSVCETAKARQNGFSHRICFSEFLRRYKFLAFDFNESVDVCKDNCRLLLVRLKMEGWALGKSKVLLKYYSEEYLSRLYEYKVKKIVKVQSIIRAYLVRRKMKKLEKNVELKKYGGEETGDKQLTPDEAAEIIQKAYKKHYTKKKSFENLDPNTVEFIRYYWKKWKARTVFQVLLQYRAARFQDLINFSQQVHLYNQHVMNSLQKINIPVESENIDQKADIASWIGVLRPTVLKLPFRLDNVPFFDTSSMCDPLTNTSFEADIDDQWNAPFQPNDSSEEPDQLSFTPNRLIELTYTRDPSEQPLVLCDSPEPPKSTPKPTPKPSPRMSQKFECTEKTTDFEYIKLKKVARGEAEVQEQRANPIAEMKVRGRRDGDVENEEEPPFNFQKMLRKTNYGRESLRRVMGKGDGEVNGVEEKVVLKKFSGELMPGVFCEGVVFEL